MKIVIATIKSWNIANARYLKQLFIDKIDIYVITNKRELTFEKLKEINPQYIFFHTGHGQYQQKYI